MILSLIEVIFKKMKKIKGKTKPVRRERFYLNLIDFEKL